MTTKLPTEAIQQPRCACKRGFRPPASLLERQRTSGTLPSSRLASGSKSTFSRTNGVIGWLPLLLGCALMVAGCSDAEEEKAAPAQAGGGGGGGKPTGGGGDVNLAAGAAPRAAVAPAPNPDLRLRYDRALANIRDKKFDDAYLELGALVTQAPDSEEAAKAAKELEQVQAKLLGMPATPPKQILSKPRKFDGKPLSVRGMYRPPEKGAAPESFGVEATGGRIECRYQRLHDDAKKALGTLPSGTKLLVRGFWKAKGPSNYLDVSLFKIE